MNAIKCWKKQVTNITPIFKMYLDMRSDVQQIFKQTPHQKQVMMFSATLASEVKNICRKFMKN